MRATNQANNYKTAASADIIRRDIKKRTTIC